MKRTCSKRTMIAALATVSMVLYSALFLSTVSWGSEELLVNGSFDRGLRGWKVTPVKTRKRVPGIAWDTSGLKGKEELNLSRNAAGGAVRIESSEEAGKLSQDFFFNPSRKTAHLSFSWKATRKVKRGKARVSIDVISPLNRKQRIWTKTLSVSKGWQTVRRMPVIPFLRARGKYRLEILAETASHGGRDIFWIDEISLKSESLDRVKSPSRFVVFEKESALQIMWEKSAGADFYRIYRSTSPSGTFERVGEVTSEASFLDRHVKKGENYIYKITSFDDLGREAPPATVIAADCCSYDEKLPATPGGVELKQEKDAITISWKNNEKIKNISGYHVYRSIGGKPFKRLTILPHPHELYIDYGFPASTSQVYKVQSVDRNGLASPLSPDIVITSVPWTEILTNGNFYGGARGWLGNSHEITWNRLGFTKSLYWGERKAVPAGGSLKMETRGVVLKELVAAQTFSYSKNESGQEVRASFAFRKAWVGFSRPASQTAGLRLRLPGGTSKIVWLDSFVEMNSSWYPVENLDLTAHMAVSGVYSLELFAGLKGTHRKASQEIWFDQVWLGAEQKPGTATAISVEMKDEKAVIRWSSSTQSGSQGFEIQRNEGQGWQPLNAGLTTGNTFIDSNLTDGVQYDYRVLSDNGKTRSLASLEVSAVAAAGETAHGPYGSVPEACQYCHGTHRQTGSFLLEYTAQSTQCFTCHGAGGSATSISNQFSGSSGHETDANGGIKCASCHDPHKSRPVSGSPGVLSGALYDVPGVTLSYSTQAWAHPARTNIATVSREYQLCLRCHAPGTQAAAQTAPREFNPNNRAQHAVIGISRASSEGSYTAGWSYTSPMDCSSCHRSAAQGGVHKSQNPNLLLKPYSDSTSGQTTGALCFDCHIRSAYGGGSTAVWASAFRNGTGTNYHNTPGGHRVACVRCHTAVPHGLNRKAMIAVTGDSAPYARGTRISSITFPADGNYREQNCGTTTGCH